MVYIGILIGGIAGFLYWNFIGCTSGACPITSNKFISVLYGALLGSLLFSSLSETKADFIKNFINKNSNGGYKHMNAEELKSKLDDTDYVIIDVRTPEEWSRGYIKGTDKFINLSADNFEDQILGLDTSKNYVLYCRSGNRSSRACELMSRKGFSKLHNLTGGINKYTGEIKKD